MAIQNAGHCVLPLAANILCLPQTLARLFYLPDKHTAINIMKSYAESCAL